MKKQIKDYPYYSVDEFGNVYSHKFNKIKKLKPTKSGYGYYSVGLYKDKIRKTHTVHELVAKCFIGLRPKGYDVNHKDGNKLNNNVSNLEYCSRLENINHACKLGLIKRGENHSCSILKKYQVVEIKKYIKNTIKFYGMYKMLSDKYNVKYKTIYGIATGANWKHIKI